MLAKQLVEQWLDGNDKKVLREISSLSPMRAACVAAQMCQVFNLSAGDITVDISFERFLQSLEDRLERKKR